MRYKLKPVDGRRVLDPLTLIPIPLEGKEVNKSKYWNRRIKSGDCEFVKEEIKKEIIVNEIKGEEND